METKDYIDFTTLNDWFARSLTRHHIVRFSQVTGRTERDLLESGVPMGTVRHIYMLLAENGMTFRDGDRCLSRLGLHRNNLLRLWDNFVCDLDDLACYTVGDLEDKLDLGPGAAKFVASRMKYFGMPLRSA